MDQKSGSKCAICILSILFSYTFWNSLKHHFRVFYHLRRSEPLGFRKSAAFLFLNLSLLFRHTKNCNTFWFEPMILGARIMDDFVTFISHHNLIRKIFKARLFHLKGNSNTVAFSHLFVVLNYQFIMFYRMILHFQQL